ncbi:hypothetical protein BS78_04G182200 [Paspalum vaginatum]|nr:hypothetical protein BS78_04G182200 [Paspalum vaginatum]
MYARHRRVSPPPPALGGWLFVLGAVNSTAESSSPTGASQCDACRAVNTQHTQQTQHTIHGKPGTGRGRPWRGRDPAGPRRPSRLPSPNEQAPCGPVLWFDHDGTIPNPPCLLPKRTALCTTTQANRPCSPPAAAAAAAGEPSRAARDTAPRRLRLRRRDGSGVRGARATQPLPQLAHPPHQAQRRAGPPPSPSSSAGAPARAGAGAGEAAVVKREAAKAASTLSVEEKEKREVIREEERGDGKGKEVGGKDDGAGRKVSVRVRAADMPLPLQRRAIRLAYEAIAAMPRLDKAPRPRAQAGI